MPLRPPGKNVFLALAPMDGVTDWVYRELATSYEHARDSIDLCVSEFVRVTDHCVPDRVLLRMCPELHHGGTTTTGTPVFVQLLGSDPVAMAETATAAARLGAPGIDINFGCPARTVNNHDGGAAILRCPGRITTIVHAVRDAVPQPTPVSVKIRVGWDSSQYVERIVEAAELGGAAWITIHGRTRTQGYRPPIDWLAIARARQAVTIPVVANGDITDLTAWKSCRGVTNGDGYMIGRGAMARPQLFREIREQRTVTVSPAAFIDLLLVYAERMVLAGHPDRAALGRLKQWLRLAAPGSPAQRRLFDRIKVKASLAEGLAELNRIREATTPDPRRQPTTRPHSSRLVQGSVDVPVRL